jgi:O-antigen/teichoic acid export membrane protein
VALLVGGWASLLLLVVQGLVLVPLYLRHLGAGTYGAWAASGDVLAWLSVLQMGVAGVGTQRMAAAHGRGDDAGVAGWFGTGVLVQAALAAVLFAAALLLSPFVPRWVGAEPDVPLAGAFAVAGAATALGLMADVAATLALALQRTVFLAAAAVAAGVAGIAATVVLLLEGWGVWALALGMLARTGLLLLATGAHAAWVLRHTLRMPARVRPAVARELRGLSGAVLLTLVGNAAAGRSDAVLVALFFGPRAVAAYVLTRRAADLISMFLARLGGAVYPGFAHLVGGGEHARAAAVLGQVARAYFWMAGPAVALYVALNRTFVALWVGPGQFAGVGVTLLAGLNVLVVGWAALVLYLNGAAGNIERNGRVIFVEAAARIGVALVLLRWWGLPGLPLAGAATAAVSSWVALRWLARRLDQPAIALPRGPVALSAALLALGAVAGRVRWGHSWAQFTAWGLAFALFATLAVLASDPEARRAAAAVWARTRPRAAAA